MIVLGSFPARSVAKAGLVVPDERRDAVRGASKDNPPSAGCLQQPLWVNCAFCAGAGRSDRLPLLRRRCAHHRSVVTLADTSSGYGCVANLPAGATGFTTIELKSNHLGTALDGTIECVASAVHLGKTTQVWDAVVTHKETGKTIALFRCTQLILYPKPGAVEAAI